MPREKVTKSKTVISRVAKRAFSVFLTKRTSGAKAKSSRRKGLPVGRKSVRSIGRVAAPRFPKLSSFRKPESNPLIEPRENNFWEMKATFNPAAMVAGGRVHLLYRAIGGGDMSVLGYAASDDGITIAERSAKPAFEHWTTDTKGARAEPLPLAVSKAEPPPDFMYCSGGGWNGGSEDPRLTLIEDDARAYLTYTAFNGWGSVRIALSSISVDDFLNQRWNWTEPIFISPPGEIQKNWVLFPEKINGRYAILHGVTPDILIEYVDSLDFDGKTFIKSSRPTNDKVEFRPGVWDSRVRGSGPPPIKTREGWLLLYHAVDATEPNRYKLGAMVLDLNDPTKVLYRSQGPVLQPKSGTRTADGNPASSIPAARS